MEAPELFPSQIGNDGQVHRELPQKEREAKQERWSSLFYKLRDENITDAERERTKEELEELRKEIT